jgi:hypothetical protein
MAAAQFLRSLRIGVPNDRTGVVNDEVTTLDQAEKRVVFLATIENGSPTKSLIKTRPDIEDAVAECHVRSIAHLPEVRDLEPALSLPTHGPPLSLFNPVKGGAFTLQRHSRILPHWEDCPGYCRDPRILEIPDQ